MSTGIFFPANHYITIIFDSYIDYNAKENKSVRFEEAVVEKDTLDQSIATSEGTNPKNSKSVSSTDIPVFF